MALTEPSPFKINSKRSNRNCSLCKQSNRFLQYAFSGEKENWRSKASHQSQAPEQMHSKETFQDGHASKDSELDQSRRLGDFSRSQRCIFAHSNSTTPSKISSIQHSKHSVSIQGNVFRSNTGTACIHESCVSGHCLSEDAQYQTRGIFGRLVDSKQSKRNASKRSRESAQSVDTVRLHNKCTKVPIIAISEHSLLRLSIQSSSRAGFSNHRENREFREFSQSSESRPSSFGQTVFDDTGDNGILHRADSICSAPHETHSNSHATFLETNLKRPRLPNTSYSTPKGTFNLVVVSSKHAEGKVTSAVVCNKGADHGCFKNRLRCSFREPSISRSMVEVREETSYQSLGTRCYIQGSDKFSTLSERPESVGPLRQHGRCTIYQQTRGDQISEPLLQILEFISTSHSEQCRTESGPHSRQFECFGGSIIETENSPNRMVSQQSDSTSSIYDLGKTNDRSFRFRTESQDNDVLLLDSEPTSLRNRCIINTMGRDDSVCISSNKSHTKGSGAHGPVSVPANSNSTTVAPTTLVHKSVINGNRLSSKSSCKRRSTQSIKVKNIPPKSRNIQTDGLVALNQNFKTAGFSKKVRKLLSESWRKGTRKDFAVKFKRFNSWCKERSKDPYSVTLAECAEFLTDLYHEGLQYRTIAGYRSMLSSVLAPVDKVPIGQHPYIVRLLKGVFNSRPPKVKLLPDWDLHKVLSMLENEPFEPLKYTSLKHLTYKVIFLVAISTFRRCSDLQSLKLGEGSVTVTSKGLIFVRHGLSKQDRADHFGTKIFVPCFKTIKS